MVQKIAERYFVFKSIEGNYQTVNINEIWDDIYSYVSKTSYYTDYGQDFIHASILKNGHNRTYLEVGFLFSDYIKPHKDIVTKEIRGGSFNVIKQRGKYREEGINKELFYYRKHLNSLDETASDCLSSEIFVLLD